MIQLEGYNFEAYPHFEIEIDRFTSLTGEGNAGKSSIIRALRAVLLNEMSMESIRVGAKECLLRLTFLNEPHNVLKVERKKSKRTNTCEIWLRDQPEPVRYSTAGNARFAELEAIGFALLRTEANEDNSFDLTFHRQFEPPVFLLQSGEPAQAAFIHNVYGLDGDEADLRRLIADTAGIRKDYDRRAGEIVAAAKQLTAAEETLGAAANARSGLAAALNAAEKADDELAGVERARGLFQQADQIQQRVEDDRRLSGQMQTALVAVQAFASACRGVLAARSLDGRWAEAETALATARLHASELRKAQPAITALRDAVDGARLALVLKADLSSALDRVQVESQRRDAARALAAALTPLKAQLTSLAGATARRRDLQAGERALATAQQRRLQVGEAQTKITAARDALRDQHAFRAFRHQLQMSVRDVERGRVRHDLLQQAQRNLQELRATLTALPTLATHRDNLLRATAVAGAAVAAKVEAETNLAAMQRIRALIRFCPTCRTPLNERHFHEVQNAA